MWKYQPSELGRRLCILANETDASATTAGRDRPILYGPYHEEALIAVHQAGVMEENKRLNTRIRTAVAERVAQGPSEENEGDQIRAKVKAADKIVDWLKKCTVSIGAVPLGDLVHAYEQIKVQGGSHG